LCTEWIRGDDDPQFTPVVVLVPVFVEPASLPDAVGDAEGFADADADAVAPSAAGAIFVLLPPETASMIPSVRASAIGIARGIAIRASLLFCVRRRHADRCRVRIRSTSTSAVALPRDHVRPSPDD
jgi:hypothetical protein